VPGCAPSAPRSLSPLRRRNLILCVISVRWEAGMRARGEHHFLLPLPSTDGALACRRRLGSPQPAVGEQRPHRNEWAQD
jgi:hypothetical protein